MSSAAEPAVMPCRIPAARPLAELVSRAPQCVFLPSACPEGIFLPLYASRVPAGFPSPADDHLEAPLNLNDYLVRRPETTFFVRVAGESMTGAGILDGDLLVVDRFLEPADRDIVIAVVASELTVKRLCLESGRYWLRPENPAFSAIPVHAEAGIEIWGVVTAVVRPLERGRKSRVR